MFHTKCEGKYEKFEETLLQIEVVMLESYCQIVVLSTLYSDVGDVVGGLNYGFPKGQQLIAEALC